VLEDGGAQLTQTAPILLRLAERYGRFGAETEDERFQILRWLFWDNHKLSGYMATYRFLRAFTPSADPAVLRFLCRRLDDSLPILVMHLRVCSFVIGETPTIRGISMIGYLMFPKYEAGFDFAVSHSSIAAWLDRISALPGWRPPYDLLPGKRLRCYIAE